ncbi:transketolase family protein [Pantoea stewartii]|uniref:Transketolase n=1 Tax=Pantoea stewartii TaxID=66269 RepID=A0AB34VJP2_9GAMM|nr:transketolase C-terminal domain-containing protein [Pantoea stewartii]KTS74619.1 transketolase [Pantoea stewartii]KTT00904.1 transketolase [Pantoea stewartii]KTT08422.1 transketolase [Pantoea stewartii]
MITIKPTQARSWSLLGSRGTFGITLLELAKEHENIIALSADLGITSGLERFSTTFPSRYFNVGIAEQNLIGVATGLSGGGYVPFATSFANFIALRACEQVRHNLGYMQGNVKLVGLAAGFAMGTFGSTHYGIEDIATLRSIPELVILSPADCSATAKMTEAAFHYNGPIYLRLTGNMRMPIVYKEDFCFEIGKAITLREGKDIALIATGSMVHVALQAAEQLNASGVSSSVVDIHTIKPLDYVALDKLLEKKLVVTLEEHSIIGGLGSAVAEYLSEKHARPPQLSLGIPQGYPHAGDYSWLLQRAGLTADQVHNRIVNFLMR